jgi:hypothetical protein
MPIVTDTALKLIRDQIRDHGPVVWYDPEQVYFKVVQQLQSQDIEGAAIFQYTEEQGFLELRYDLETIWGQAIDPPKLLIYVPLSQGATHHALIEFEEAGIVMQPGRQPPACNTALAVVARRALAPVRPASALAQIVAEVEAGKWTLEELDQDAERTMDQQAGVLKVIFGTGNAGEIALRFVADPDLDPAIEAKEATGILAGLLSDLLGADLTAQSLTDLRARLARRLLMTDLLVALGEDAPAALRTFPLAEREVARETACDLTEAWRNRLDLAERYKGWADKLQPEIGAHVSGIPLAALARVTTFAAAEMALQERVEQALLQRATQELLALAQSRLDQGFWAQHEPTIKLRWTVIVDAARALLESRRVDHALKGDSWSAETLLSRYAYGENDAPWAALDTAQRHLERDAHRFDLDPRRHDTLHKLIVSARQRYAASANALAKAFVEAYQRARFNLPGQLLQADIYRRIVKPAQQAGRVAYILVDALRYEMAQELAGMLEPAWSGDLVAALATPPTVTEVGMAALMPGAEAGLMLLASGGRPAIALAGATLRVRQDRVTYFEETFDGSSVVTKLEELAPLSDKALSRRLDQAQVVLVTATEGIDGFFENTPALAQRMLDDVFNQLRRGMRALFSHGIETVVITADHGYLFGENLVPGEPMDAPGGDTLLLKRRVWVGKGGAASDSLLRTPITAFGIGGDFELATPWNLACFKVKGGGLSYFHGGLSLPEVVIPVLTIHAEGARAASEEPRVRWILSPGSRTITSRFVSVNVTGEATQLLPLDPPLVRAEVRAGGHVISVPVSASYGFSEATKDVQLKLRDDNSRAVAKNTLMLMITDEVDVESVSLYLLDAATGFTLARLDDIPFNLAF